MASSDIEGMLSCYDNDILFEDPAFGKLQGDRAKNMWRMLLSNNKAKIKVNFSDVEATEKSGSANWIAEYNFNQTGRDVHNVISATFEFRNNKIIKHTNHFNLHMWSKQALGFSGYLIGWTPFFKKKLQKITNEKLSRFIQKL